MGSGSSCIVFPLLFCCNFSNLLSKIQVLVKLSHKPLILSLPTTLVTVKMLSIGFLLHFGNFSVVLKRRNIFFQWIGLNLHSFSLFILLIFVVFCLLHLVQLRLFCIHFFSNIGCQYTHLFLSTVAKLPYSITKKRKRAKGAVLKYKTIL